MPGRETVFRWLREHDAFRDQYARAKAESVHALAEEILEIADDTSGDYDAEGRLRPENIQRSRLRVDTRKWILSKLAPHRYGDRIDLNHGGQEENPIRALIMSVQGTSIRPVPAQEQAAIDITPTADKDDRGAGRPVLNHMSRSVPRRDAAPAAALPAIFLPPVSWHPRLPATRDVLRI